MPLFRGPDPAPQGDQRRANANDIVGRLSGRTVRCYCCGGWFKAAVRAESATCGHCYAHVHVQDIALKEAFWGSSVMSCGRINVGRRGKIRAKLMVACHGIQIDGLVEAQILCGGPVHLGRDAHVRGSIAAPSLTVDAGAVLESVSIAAPSHPIGSIELPRTGAGRVISATPAPNAGSGLRVGPHGGSAAGSTIGPGVPA